MVPGDGGLLRAVVEIRAETREVFRRRGDATAGRKSAFLPARISSEERIAAGKIVVDAYCALIVRMRLITNIQVIVGVGSCSFHHHVGYGNVRHQKCLQKRTDAIAWNHVAGK